MSDFTSYSAYVPEEQNDKAPPTLNLNNDQFARATVVNGVSTLEHIDKNASHNGYYANTYAADDWRSTAKDHRGNQSAMVGDSTRVTINGIEATAIDFMKAGYLEKDDRGNYRMAGEEPAEDPQEAQLAEAQQHYAELAPEANAIVNSALEGLSDAGVETVTQYGIGMALGHLSTGLLVRQVSTMTGSDMAASEAKVETVRQVYQQQADDYIVSSLGVDREDLPGFYEFARRSQNRDALSKAVNRQIYSKRMDGYKSLAQLYMGTTAPSDQSLKAGGFETMVGRDGTQMVKYQGMWMSAKVAAFNGWI
jgi:hypothetical protein